MFQQIIDTVLGAFSGYITTWLLIISILLAAFYYYSTSFVGVFKTVGIPGPTPWPIINHIPELKKHGLSKMLDDWRKKYGKTYGIYGFFPRAATIVTFDTRLLEHVMVKDFNNFVDRVGRKSTLSSVTHGLFFLNGNAWRRSRHVLSPMFTAGRLKQMLSHVSTSSANFVSLIKTQKDQGKLIPLKALACRYTSDVIARVGFGVDSKALTEENSEFAYHIDNFIRIPATRLQNILRTIGEFFPPVMEVGLQLFNKQVDAILPETENYFVNFVKEAISRRETDVKNPDLSKKQNVNMLDLLLTAEIEDISPDSLKAENRKIVRKEVIGNSTILILAAFETTSTALSSILYLLARHEHIQDKVIEEIDDVLNGKSSPSYEDLSKLVYTTQVIYESLRMFPPSPDITRRALETRTYDGVTIPKGTVIFIPIYKIVKDEQYYPDPYKFDPDRFSPQRRAEIDPVAFLPFGYGRRQCVAKRLALMELKVVLCQLLSNMRFVQTENTVPKKGCDAEYIHVDGFFVAKQPIQLDIVLRDNH